MWLPKQCLNKGDFQNYAKENVRSTGQSKDGRASKKEKYWRRGKGKINGKCRILDKVALIAERKRNW